MAQLQEAGFLERNGPGGADRTSEPVEAGLPMATDALALEQEIARAIHPILSNALVPLAAYFACIIPFYYLIETEFGFRVLAPISAATAALLLLARFRWFSDYKSIGQLELISLFVGFLIYGNIIAFLHFHPEPSRLSYFILCMICIVTMSATLRTVLFGSAISLATMVWMASGFGPDILEQFAMLAIAAAFTGTGMVILMRAAVKGAVKSRMLAEALRIKAQDLAHQDPLTGLPNRRIFFQVFEELVSASGPDRPFALAIIDLDGFKPINDLYGHQTGDHLLVTVGDRLRDLLSGERMLARLGGDEFSILITRPLSDDELQALGRAAIAALQRPFQLDGHELSISASVGFARFPANGRSVNEIYERADHALYSAKSYSRGDAVIFSDRHEREISDVGRVEQALRSSDLARELTVVFQPQLDIAEQRVVGFEALARWNSAALGAVPPSIFVTAAERCGMIGALTEILVRKTLEAMETIPSNIRVAINLSARDIVSERATNRIAEIVRASGIAPQRIEFEITETAIMADFETACASLAMLSGMGCRIALDDFGSGYSSFGYIHRFPLNKIKIDRSFVAGLDDGPVGHDVIRAIVDLCRNLGFDCLVEGIETPEQLHSVRASGARYAQGYYFSRPMPLEEVQAYLRDTPGTALSA